MEFITQTINTKDMTVRLIVATLYKFVEEGKTNGRINLSLDLSHPEYIEVTMKGLHVETDELKPSFAYCQYFREGQEIYSANISLDTTLQEEIESILDIVAEHVDKEIFEQKCYEAYQLDWMMRHGYSLSDLYKVQLKYMKEVFDEEVLYGVGNFNINNFKKDALDYMMSQARDTILFQKGFAGTEVFASKDEFLITEYLYPDYMIRLLDNMPDSSNMKKKYEYYTEVSLTKLQEYIEKHLN